MQSDYEIAFLSVGHGDASLICETTKRHAVLIDAATFAPVLAVLSAQVNLKAIFITHWDEDHIGGIPAVISYLKSINNSEVVVFINRQSAETKIVKRFRRALDEGREDGTIKINMAYKEYPGKVDLIGGSFVILWPCHYVGVVNDADKNLDCLILRFESNKLSILLGGDAKGIVWPQIESKQLKAKILRFPHHGGKLCNSKDSWSADKLISEVDPVYIVVSVRSNSRHHPSDEFFTAMKNHSKRQFLFTSNGDISLRVDSNSGSIASSPIVEK